MRIYGHHHCLIADDAYIQARRAIGAGIFPVQIPFLWFAARHIMVDRAGDYGVVALMQPAEHVANDGADFALAMRLLYQGTKLVPHGGPIDPIQRGIPMLVPDGGPNLVEGCQAIAALFRGQRRDTQSRTEIQ